LDVVGEVLSKQTWQKTPILFDGGSEINVVSQRYVAEMQLPSVEVELPVASWLTKQSSYCYGAHEITYRICDNWGRVKEAKGLFYAFDMDAPPLLLGMPALHEDGIMIDYGAEAWRWPIESNALSIETPEQFEKSMMGEPAVYAVIVSAVQTSKQTEGESHAIPLYLQEFTDVFDNEAAATIAENKETDHAIDLLPDSDAPYIPLYNMSAKELLLLREYLDSSLQKGWIRHSTSPAGAPTLFVPKKDGSLRLCIDYRALNKITIKNRHPLPLISETLDRLCGAKFYTKLDLKDAYHRIRIKRGDEWKTAFRTRYGHFEYTVMPFGLTNAPATFQAYINRALAGLVDVICVVYLDDILIYSMTQAEHRRNTATVLERLRKFQLYANLKKCEFDTQEVEFLGFIISPDGVKMDPRRVVAISEWPVPQTLREVQVFLGFANFYRRFVKDYSRVAAPMSSMMKGSKGGKPTGAFRWDESEERAFRSLIACFTNAPMLKHFDPALRLRCETDASDFAISAILSQLHGDVWHPIAFFSRKMIPAECNYEVHDKELLAIVMALKQWRHYCEGSAHTIQILTDHNNLRGFMGVKALTGRQARWSLVLAAYDFVIIHRPGKSNPADAPSRRPDYARDAQALNMLPSLQKKLGRVGAIHIFRPWLPSMRKDCEQIAPGGLSTVYGPCETEPEDETLVSLGVDSQAEHNAIAEGENRDQPICRQMVPRQLVRQMLIGTSPYQGQGESSKNLVRELQLKDKFVQDWKEHLERPRRAGRKQGWHFKPNGLLYYNQGLYVPQEAAVRSEILMRYHDDPLAGHFGAEKTTELVSRFFYWQSLSADCKKHVQTCDVCQRIRAPRHRPYGEMQALPHPEGPWQEITWDFVTGLPPSKRNGCVYDAILVVVDRYTKMALYIPTNITLTAVELADIFFTQIASRFGTPKGIVSDRGSLFTSEFWSEVCYYSQVKRRLSTAFHPQTDGQTEIQNQSLEHYLRAFCNTEQNDWAKLLPLAEFAYNNSIHSATAITPFFACYGFAPQFRFEAEDSSHEERVPAAVERVRELETLRKELARRWEVASGQQTRAYNKNHIPMQFKIGDLVMLSTKNLKQKRPSKKLSHRYIGPFQVQDAIGKQAYRLNLPEKYKIHNVFHVSYLEPYQQRAGCVLPAFLGPDLIDGAEEWEVEEILGRKKKQGELWYHVKWTGWPDEYNAWVPQPDLQGAETLRQEFDRRQQISTKRGRPRGRGRGH